MYTRHHWILSYREISFVLRSVALAKLFPRQQNCRWGKCHSRTVSRFSRTWNKAKSMNYSSLLNGESQSKNRVFFVNANNNLPLSLATHRSSSFQSAGFPYEIRLQRSLKFEPWLLPPFWIVLSSQAAFSWRHSVQEIFSNPGCSWAILFWVKPEKIALKIAKLVIHQKK